MVDQTNVARVAGGVASSPITINHYGESFYSFLLSVKRASGVSDTIPIKVSKYLVEDLSLGDKIALQGQIRTYRKLVGGKSHLIIIFLATDVMQYEADLNSINVTGFICTNPKHRVTPLGREITDLILAVQSSQDRADYIPCIVWDKKSQFAAGLKTGTRVKISGRLQSRRYTKTLPDGSVEEKTAYELSVGTILELK